MLTLLMACLSVYIVNKPLLDSRLCKNTFRGHVVFCIPSLR